MKLNRKRKRQEIPASTNPPRLPDQLKTGLENLSGYSMDDVKVHYNSDKQIHLAPTEEKHLAQEDWHVVQQQQGRIKPSEIIKNDAPVNEESSLEEEADNLGSKALGQIINKKEDPAT